VKSKRFFQIFLILLFILSTCPFVQAEDAPVQIFILVDNENIVIGDTITITVYTCKNSNPISPDQLSISYRISNNITELDLIEDTTGIYVTTFSLTEEISSERILEFKAIAQLDGIKTETIKILTTHSLHSTTTINNLFPASGNTIVVTSHTFDNDVRYDPESLRIWVYVDYQEEFWNSEQKKQELVVGKLTEGVFRSTYKISPEDTSSHTYRFVTEIKEGNFSTFSYAEASLRYYQVYFNENIEVSSKSDVAYDIHVTDRYNRRVSGASVSFTYSLFNNNIIISEGKKIGITNSLGKLSDSFHRMDFNCIHISGWINGSFQQKFQGEISVDQDVHEKSKLISLEDGFDVISYEQSSLLPPDQAIELSFGAFNNGSAIVNENISFYVFTDTSFLFQGTAQTTLGLFSVPFNTPKIQEHRRYLIVTIRFVYNSSQGVVYDSLQFPIMSLNDSINSNLVLEIDTLDIGTKSKIQVNNITLNRYHGYVYTFPLPEVLREKNILEILQEINLMDPNQFLIGNSSGWNYWTKGGRFGNAYPLTEMELGSFSGEFFTPDIWEREKAFIVIVVFIDSFIFEGLPHDLQMNAVILEDGEGTNDGDHSGDSDFISSFQTPMVFLSIFVGLFILDRKLKARL